jgi:histidyl-tRNA synthetase
LHHTLTSRATVKPSFKVVCEILHNLDIGAFKIKLNHRKLLDGR